MSLHLLLVLILVSMMIGNLPKGLVVVVFVVFNASAAEIAVEFIGDAVISVTNDVVDCCCNIFS